MSVNVLDLDAPRLADFFVQLGEKPYRAKQLMQWLYQRGETEFSRMTDMSEPLRARLAEQAHVGTITVASETISSDGTHKWLVDVGNHNCVETVYIPEENRNTLCISSQVGCALTCTFCATGQQGFNRNLTTAEIIGQLQLAHQVFGHAHKSETRVVSNVVMMGMGEPLANFNNVVTALHIMLDDHAYGLSRRRVTVSTSGLIPAMDRLRDECPVALAVSLHAPDDALRDQIVPINQKYPLRVLMQACLRYLEKAPRDFITFEYVMLSGVNDSLKQAQTLIDLVKSVPCKFNLIPFNPFPGSSYQTSSPQAVAQFRDTLMQAGHVATIRKTRGNDIAAACGQLAGQIQSRVSRQRPASTP